MVGDEWLDPGQIQSAFGCSRAYVHVLASRNHWRKLKIGHSSYFRTDDVARTIVRRQAMGFDLPDVALIFGAYWWDGVLRAVQEMGVERVIQEMDKRTINDTPDNTNARK